jgi:hypothetical protein
MIRIANWVARFYNRTALPTELVSRLKAAAFQDKITELLSVWFEGNPLHEQVSVIFGNWEPDDEEGPYRLELDIVVRSIEAMDFLLVVLKNAFALPSLEILIESIEGVVINIEVLEYETVTLAMLDQRRRISEWDLLSGLMDEA